MSQSSGADSVDGLVRAKGWEIYPASLAQRRLWFLNELQAPTAAYNVNIGLWLYGALQIDALRSSLQQVVNRHESLRTCFALQGSELVQLVQPRHDVSLELTDFSDLEDPYPPTYEFAKREAAEPFDLNKGPLFRVKLIRIRPEEHVLLCTMHHTITDSWSMQVFTRELASLYEAFTSGNEPRLPELTIQYGDFADWQCQLLDADFAQTQLAYWRRILQGVPSLLRLPTDYPRPAEQSLAGMSHTFAVPGEIISKVTSLAGEQNVTAFMLLLAAFKVLLHRYSGQSDVSVGVPVAGRTRVETEPLIGFFVDTLVLRDDLSGNPRFTDLLSKVRETTIGALGNADVPFEKVVEMIRPERSLSFNPIFQVMFSVIKSAIRSHQFGEIVAYPYVVNASTSILDLCATFIEDTDGKWWLQIDFDTALFKMERVQRLFDDYMELLRQLVVRPDLKIDQIAIPNAPTPEQVANITPDESGMVPSIAAAVQVPESDYASEREFLLEVWKHVLGVERVGIHDNFFDVGGHSLLAAHVAAHIHRITGRRIPVSAIFRAPTIEELALLLHEDADKRPDPLLMELSRGDHKIPLFAIAEPGVDTLGFGILARTLGQPYSVYKLQAAGDPTWERPFEQRELQSLAEQYVSAMRTVQPHGPYCVGAMCNGVLIAQEMIQQLESQGEEVALFAILDTWVRENSMVRGLWMLSYYKDRLRTLPNMSRRKRLDVAARTVKRLIKRSDKRRTKWAEVYWPDPSFRTPRFAAPVLLFKRPRQPFFYVRDPEMGWGKRSMRGVEICDVNCGHFEFLRQPHVTLVANRLSAWLNEINQHADDGEPVRSLIPVSPVTPSSVKQSVA
jgi:thioesterase domain-containing protein